MGGDLLTLQQDSPASQPVNLWEMTTMTYKHEPVANTFSSISSNNQTNTCKLLETIFTSTYCCVPGLQKSVLPTQDGDTLELGGDT